VARADERAAILDRDSERGAPPAPPVGGRVGRSGVNVAMARVLL